MSTLMTFPQLDTVLPDLRAFIRLLSHSIRSIGPDSFNQAANLVQEFFTPEQLANLEAVAPGWSDLIEHDQHATLLHVMLAMASLPFLHEYRDASPEEQSMVDWALLFHDIAKRSKHERDHTHAFRSAVVAARSIPLTGFVVPESYHRDIDEWSHLTLAATCCQSDSDTRVQDNHQLPGILSGVDLMLGQNTASAMIVKLILLAIAAGLFIGAGLIVVMESLRNTVAGAKDIKSLGFKVLAEIPTIVDPVAVAMSRKKDVAVYCAALIYFSALGAGFMLIEILKKARPNLKEIVVCLF